MSKRIHHLSPLALLALTACGGGGGGGSSSGSSSSGGSGSSGSSSYSILGKVIKGPLTNALVFLDYNDNGTFDAGETSVRTASDGSYTLTSSQASVSIVALTDDTTIDSSSGSVLTGVTLRAPSGASVVSPNTTLMKEAGLTAAEVGEVLGLSADIDITTFNPYATGVDAAKALAVEKVSQQIMTTISTFAAVTEGSGASAADSFSTALASVVEVVQQKAVAFKSDPSVKLDLSSTDDLASINSSVTTKAASVSGVDQTALATISNDTATAIKNVNAKIDTVTDLTSDDSKNVFSTTQVLSEQVETAAKTEAAGGSGSIEFVNTARIDSAAANAAPTDISLSASTISENAGSLIIGSFSTTDDQKSGGFTYRLARVEGTDHSAFNLNTATGQLSLKSQPDFETKSTYSISVVSTDAGGKSYSKAFKISISDANDTPTITSTSITASKEDSAYSYKFAASDVDSGDTVTYAATKLPSWLKFNAGTGVLSGTPTNSEVGTHSVVLTATDSSGAVDTQSFTITVSNVNDTPTVTSTAVTAAKEDSAYSYTFAASDVDTGDTITYAATKVPSWLSINSSTGVLSGTPTNSDVGSHSVVLTATDSGGAVDTQSFTITVSKINSAPKNLSLSSNSLAENSSTGIIGTLNASDPDIGDTLTYNLASGGDNGNFEIVGTTLKMSSDHLSKLNYEQDNSYSVSITARDGSGATTSLDTQINITNVNEASVSRYNAKSDTFASSSLNPTNNPNFENLMSGYTWGNSIGNGIDLTYSLISSSSKLSSGYKDTGSIQNPSSIFQSTVTEILNLYSSVSLLSFSEVSETGDTTGHIRIGTSTGPPTEAYAWYPYPNFYASGDIWLKSETDNYNKSTKLVDGTYWNAAIVHEIGHSLGLAHPHEAETINGKTYGTNVSSGEIHSSLPYSVMSYAEYVGETIGSSSNNYSKPTTLMIDDIAALQYLYGINEQYNAGDNLYTLGSFSKDSLDYVYASIWDAGGNDTFSWADQSTIGAIDLNPGSFSCFGNISSVKDTDLASNTWSAGDGLLGIAYNANIENAIGGSASDTIAGNSSANTLYGGAGAGVKDTLTGNGGADIFVCSLSDASTDLSVADIISDFTDGSDKIGLEDRTFSNLAISNGTGSYSDDTQIVDSSSGKVLFLLEGIHAGLIDENDFVVTDFV